MKRAGKLPGVYKGVLWPRRGADCLEGGHGHAEPGGSDSPGRVVLGSEGPVTKVVAKRLREDRLGCDSGVPKTLRSEGPVWSRSRGGRQEGLEEGRGSRRLQQEVWDTGASSSGLQQRSVKDRQEEVARILSTAEGREAATNILEEGMLAASTRVARESKLATLQRYALMSGAELFPLKRGLLPS